MSLHSTSFWNLFIVFFKIYIQDELAFRLFCKKHIVLPKDPNPDFFMEFILYIMVFIWKFLFFSFFSWRVLAGWKLVFHDALDPVFDVNHQEKSTYLFESKTFLMKDGKQKNGEDFSTQPSCIGTSNAPKP
jgi:hypothetical protein